MGGMEPAALRSLALTNYGHFTSMRVTDGLTRGLHLHLERLAQDAMSLFGAELNLGDIRQLCRMKADGLDAAVIRVTVLDPELDIGHPYSSKVEPQVLVTAREGAALPAPPLTAHTARYQREVATVKHVGLFGTIFLRRQAQLAGFDDVLFLDDRANAYEGATWNIGFICGGRVIWPKGDCLPGVTMRLLQEVYPHTSAYVPSSELRHMDAAFATNANIAVRPIKRVDDIELDVGHPIIAELQEAYADIPPEKL